MSDVKKITAADPESHSLDPVAENLNQLKALFPEAFTEGKVDLGILKQLLGTAIDEREEKYGLNWHGKRRARQLALTASAGTLRPCPEESLDWDTTQNLMIEGDNLEVLKLLQKSYAGRVKLIYIDPPYNTGEDFVYEDDFQDNIRNYLELTGQVEGGRKISSNTEASGRFHTAWLNMMYPRLRLARVLLRKDGVIIVSVDDTEAANLRLICDSVFGVENFIAQIVWEGANKNDARQIGVSHEYALVYAHTREALPREWGIAKEGVEPVLKEVQRLKQKHKDDWDAASEDLAGWFRAMKAKPSFVNRRFRNIDARGAYKEDDPTAPGGRRFQLRNPNTGEVIPLRKNRGWGFDQAEFERLVSEGRISFITSTSIMVRRYLHETDKMTPQSVFYQPARSASERLARLMGAAVFDFPKDELVLQKFVEMATDATDEECIVVDFFAGSGTTAEAVMRQNVADGGHRRYVLVQLPEPLNPENEAQKVAADYCKKLNKPLNIAELTKERLRRVAARLEKESPKALLDKGFRVFKLDSTNILEWAPKEGDVQAALQTSIEHLKAKRAEQDVLYELLLKLGLDLCVPVVKEIVAKKDVHAVGGGVLMACLAEKIGTKEVESLALGIVDWHKALAPAGDVTCVFRDSAFEDDVAKTNMAAILEQHGLKNVRSL
jgi:adenine-specific DNA-methyltransferase